MKRLIWKSKTGIWKIHNTNLIQYDTIKWNTNCYAKVEQFTALYYIWKVTMYNGILDAGMHIFASHGYLSERGNSYLIWQYKDGFVVYKSINNRLTEKRRFRSKTIKNKTYYCKVKYDPSQGKITIWRDEILIGSWIDKNPIKNGRYISLRTNQTHADFSDIRIYSANSISPKSGYSFQ